ncbi:MAG: acylphosphatase [Bacteroidales bacterium]|nr:acylphosphatase [Bacteroidales bacterium]
MKHLNITVRGRVQRIGFRFYTMEAAYKYRVNGFVMNQDDDSVYIEAEGEEEAVEKFLQWCHKGPLVARVEEVEFKEGPIKEYTSFEIKSRTKWLNTDKNESG